MNNIYQGPKYQIPQYQIRGDSQTSSINVYSSENYGGGEGDTSSPNGSIGFYVASENIEGYNLVAFDLNGELCYSNNEPNPNTVPPENFKPAVGIIKADVAKGERVEVFNNLIIDLDFLCSVPEGTIPYGSILKDRAYFLGKPLPLTDNTEFFQGGWRENWNFVKGNCFQQIGRGRDQNKLHVNCGPWHKMV